MYSTQQNLKQILLLKKDETDKNIETDKKHISNHTSTSTSTKKHWILIEPCDVSLFVKLCAVTKFICKLTLKFQEAQKHLNAFLEPHHRS